MFESSTFFLNSSSYKYIQTQRRFPPPPLLQLSSTHTYEKDNCVGKVHPSYPHWIQFYDSEKKKYTADKYVYPLGKCYEMRQKMNNLTESWTYLTCKDTYDASAHNVTFRCYSRSHECHDTSKTYTPKFTETKKCGVCDKGELVLCPPEHVRPVNKLGATPAGMYTWAVSSSKKYKYKLSQLWFHVYVYTRSSEELRIKTMCLMRYSLLSVQSYKGPGCTGDLSAIDTLLSQKADGSPATYTHALDKCVGHRSRNHPSDEWEYVYFKDVYDPRTHTINYTAHKSSKCDDESPLFDESDECDKCIEHCDGGWCEDTKGMIDGTIVSSSMISGCPAPPPSQSPAPNPPRPKTADPKQGYKIEVSLLRTKR